MLGHSISWKNCQQIDWSDSKDDWDADAWEDHLNHEVDGGRESKLSEEPVSDYCDADRWVSISGETEYSRNWLHTSHALRDDYNFQCQRCFSILEDRKRLLHVHHRSRDKKDNRSANLIVLCVLCHSEEEGHEHLAENLDGLDVEYIKRGG